MACMWHQGGKLTRWSRVCRPCTPKVVALLELTESQRDTYRDSMFAATGQVERLDRELTQARKLLEEAAVVMKRGRLSRPLSGRIVAFLGGPI